MKFKLPAALLVIFLLGVSFGLLFGVALDRLYLETAGQFLP